MNNQVRFEAEAFPAIGAFKRFLSGVDSFVSPKARFLSETFPAVRAFIGFLLHWHFPFWKVSLVMLHKVRDLPEAFATVWTLIRLLSGVSPLVFFQISGLAEPFPTVTTFVWFLSRVSPLMGNEVRARAERFLTA